MKEGWDVKSLMDIANIGTGKRDANHATEKGDYRFYTCAYDYLFCNTKRFSGECLILPGNGVNVGEVFFYDGEFDAYQRTYIISEIKILPKYLHYHMLLNWKTLGTKKQYGSATNFIKIGNFKEYKVEYPPLPEQKRIVAILDQAFAAIDKAKENAQKNLKNAKDLFASYLQGVFENKGEGWEEKRLGEIADVEYGYTDKSTEEGDYRYIRITDIDKNGELILENKKYIKYSKEASGFLIQNNDLLMARTGATFAKVLLFNGDEPSVFASYLIRIKFNQKIENALYWYFTKTNYYWEQASSLQSGAAQPHFNGAALKQVIFPYPKSNKEQKVLIKKFKTLSTQTKSLESHYQTKIDNLEELKKSLLQKAFNGELSSQDSLLSINEGLL